MIADRLKMTAVGLLTFALLVLIRHQVDSYNLTPEILKIINTFTVLMVCFLIVVVTRAWIPRRG